MILRERSFHICLNTRRDFSRPLSTKISSFLEINLTIFSEISSFQGGWFLFEDDKKSFNIMIAIKMFRFESLKFGCESSSSLFYSKTNPHSKTHEVKEPLQLTHVLLKSESDLVLFLRIVIDCHD